MMGDIGRLMFLLSFVVAAPCSFAQSTKSTDSPSVQLTAERAVKFHRAGDLHFSPDGSTLVCVISEMSGGATQSHLWVLHIGHGELKQLTFSQKSERSPKWSPNGSLAFLSNRAGPMQVYVMSTEGGEARAVTASESGIGSFQWSPDGRQIAFLAREPASKQKQEDHDEKIADREQDLERLWIVDLDSRKVRQVTTGAWRIEEFDWLSADHIIARASDRPSAEVLTDAIYDISVADGRTILVDQPNQPFSRLSVAPDRMHFTFRSTRTAGPEPHDLFLQSVSGGAAKDVTANIDRAVLETQWQDGSTVWVRVADGFRNRIFRIDSHGVIQAIDLPCSAGSFDVAHDGTLGFVRNGFNLLPEVFLRRTDGEISQVSHLQEGWDGIRLIDPEIFRFKSFDKTPVEAALFKPADEPKGQKLPLVLLVHGGPAGNFSAEYYWFNSWSQILAARGYQVLLVNPRGSTGYGETFLKANRRDWGGGDFKDLIAGLDTVIARGETDPRRIGIGGWSYGGEMTEWAITQTNRFKAAVAGAGVFDQTAEFESEEIANPDEWYLGTPWEQPDVFARNSPSTYIRKAKTPTLILHGEDDDTNPVGQSQALYRALKRYGVETQLVVYPGETHLPRQEKHQIDVLERMVDWFDRHLN
jgi:dipeptidyl aminopeptidase/acylaminoacyl peptidase